MGYLVPYMVRTMKDENIVKYLRRELRKEPEYKTTIEAIEEGFIGGAYLNLFSEDHDARMLAKQMAWAGVQKRLVSFWDIVRGLIPSHVNLKGEPEV
jgi:hypothetical protein